MVVTIDLGQATSRNQDIDPGLSWKQWDQLLQLLQAYYHRAGLEVGLLAHSRDAGVKGNSLTCLNTSLMDILFGILSNLKIT